jgi:hypothetical protein
VRRTNVIQIGKQVFEGQPEVRVYHVHTKLTDAVAECGMKNEEVQSGILEAFLNVSGVEAAQVSPYSVAIVKARMFSWAEVEPSIKALLTSLEMPIDSVNK